MALKTLLTCRDKSIDVSFYKSISSIFLLVLNFIRSDKLIQKTLVHTLLRFFWDVLHEHEAGNWHRSLTARCWHTPPTVTAHRKSQWATLQCTLAYGQRVDLAHWHISARDHARSGVGSGVKPENVACVHVLPVCGAAHGISLPCLPDTSLGIE